MSIIFNTQDGASPERKRTTGRFFVKDIHYANSAVKFWCGLIDEAVEDFPECTMIELSASSSEDLTPDLLFPEIALEKDIERLLSADIETEMQKTIDELDILGPPAPVQIRLLAQENEIFVRELPLDVIDAEIFSSLLVWPLKWAEIHEILWNNSVLEGSISIEDRRLRRHYNASFKLRKDDLSEGLFRRSISINHSVTAKTTEP